MLRSLLLALSLFSISQLTSAAIFQSENSDLNCTQYEVVNKHKNDAGKYVYTRELKRGEKVLTDKTIYGLSISNMTINFNQRTASFDLIKNVTLGLNRPLFVMGTRVNIDSSNERFNEVINLVNRKMYLIQSICLDENQNIIDITHELEQ